MGIREKKKHMARVGGGWELHEKQTCFPEEVCFTIRLLRQKYAV
jgi:hypothetical protein